VDDADAFDALDDGPEEMRLDALAAAAGVATTTIRLYQQRGLMPGPRLVGRTGWYSRHHLARLRLIGRLQEQGFSLAGIGRLLEAADRGGDLTDLVGVGAELDAVVRRAQPTVVEPAELVDRLGPDALSPPVIGRAVELGLVEGTDDGKLRIPDQRFIDIGSELVRLGVSVDVVLDEWVRLRALTDRIAERFVAVFETQIFGPDRRDHIDAEVASRAAEALPHLVRLATQVVTAALENSLADHVDRRIGELVARPT
jgi:DNA-binding transcriptional MerR regulator